MRLDRLFKFRESSENPDAVKPFLDHLEDLRRMLMKIALTLGIGMAIAGVFYHQLIAIVQYPLHNLDPVLARLQSQTVTDSIMVIVDTAFYAGIVLTFPVLLYFIAQFVLPALTPRERKIVLPAVGTSFLLFVIGVVFSYFCVLPRTLKFFYDVAKGNQWQPIWHVREYYAFVTQISLAFGAAFELPVVVLLLVYFRVLTAGFLRRTRSYAVIVILVMAMIIAPTPDVVTFLSLGVPMYLLYEICIWLAWFVERSRLKALQNKSREFPNSE